METKKEWDPQFKDFSFVQDRRGPEQQGVFNQQFHGTFATSPRDFCVAAERRMLADGSVVMVAQSVVHPGCPPRSGYVRADLRLGGYILKAIDGGARTDLTSITSLN